jgi:hypothetical protein
MSLYIDFILNLEKRIICKHYNINERYVPRFFFIHVKKYIFFNSLILFGKTIINLKSKLDIVSINNILLKSLPGSKLYFDTLISFNSNINI